MTGKGAFCCAADYGVKDISVPAGSICEEKG